MEKQELNLDHPIFVVYFDGQRLPKDCINSMVESFKKSIDIYSNAVFWYVVSDKTAIECIYDGSVRSRNSEISHILEEINKRIEVLSESGDFEDFKINIRNWRIEKIIE